MSDTSMILQDDNLFVPRLTNYLRNQRQQYFYIDSEIVARNHYLSLHPLSLPAPVLSWREFACGVDTSDGQAAKIARDKLTEFVNLSADVTQGVTFFEADRTIYSALCACNGSYWQARRELEAAVGYLNPSKWEQLVSLVNDLEAWRNLHRKTKDMPSSMKAQKEWGIDLDVIMPADVKKAKSELYKVLSCCFEESDITSTAIDDYEDVGDSVTAHKALKQDEMRESFTSKAEWLYRHCEDHVKLGFSAMSALDLANSVVALIQSNQGDIHELQGPLFDLLGEGNLKLIMEILENVDSLLCVDIVEFEQLASGLSSAITSHIGMTRSSAQTRTGPSVGAQITIQSTSEIEAKKQFRKDQKRLNKMAISTGSDQPEVPDWLKSVGFDEQYLEQERLLGLQNGTQSLPPGYTYSPELGLLAPEGSREYHEPTGGLPSNATKLVVPGEYEEVYIPAKKKTGIVDESNLVPISSLEPWAQTAFRGTERLNPMQSAVFEVAYHSAQNMLVCAPTGAGKTNVAMLALLQLVRRHMTDGQLDRHDLKAVYVAPMKALAQEVVSKFGQRLKPLGLVVKEYTGDMQLTRTEVEEANLVVTTPEKWDVVTRKGGEGALVASVGLLLIDEVHLLADDRGAVIESIVARTRRMVEASQRFVRIVGLSATLPNYKDVATFLQVRIGSGGGLFHFGPEHRPVPLDQTFIGVMEKQRMRQIAKLNKIAYDRAIASVREGNQVMVFVHARKDTVRTAEALLELAAIDGCPDEFALEGAEIRAKHTSAVAKSRSKELRHLFASGIGCHHAGMLRSDRGLTERAFEEGGLRLIVCTATLAWGVNLPAHTVIIKGTEVYNPEKGGADDLSILDVLQIFGRAGRPQYDTHGEAILITTHKSLDRYLALLARATPIESNLIKSLPDHLNAEIAAGTVTNVREAVLWLTYTYLYVRMQKNPMLYGITLAEAEVDPRAEQRRDALIKQAADSLDDRKMIRHDRRSGNLGSTHLGRAASHFYINHESVFRFNASMKQQMSDGAVLALVCQACEFDQIRVRPEELKDLDDLRNSCPFDVKMPSEDTAGKVNILLQSHIGGQRSNSFTLTSDGNYIAQNAGRVSRALFEIALRKGWSSLAKRLLELSIAIDRSIWWFQNPLRQFSGELPIQVLDTLDEKAPKIEALLDMRHKEVGQLCGVHRLGEKVLKLAKCLPRLQVEASIQPVTRGILRVTLKIEGKFEWQDRWHSHAEPWWIWVEDSESERIYHSEHFSLTKKGRIGEHLIVFTIPVFEPLPPQYWVRAISDRWLGCETVVPIPFRHIMLPEKHYSHTDLLDLSPLPVTALQNPSFQSIFGGYTHFNPIQTQLFHVLYHTDANVLLGAPTGSGKTAVAEIALLRTINQSNLSKKNGGSGFLAVYIAPLKALARERLSDWRKKLGEKLGLSVLELTGDSAPDTNALKKADVIITTPEKWDGVTRGWKSRPYVSRATLLMIDEIHLLGEDRGPVLEVIVSRMRYISAQTGNLVRFIGLSTALANAKDLGDWLGVSETGVGLYNFRPSVRPIPCEVHIQGYPGKHYCPRMATMNKPTYAAIMEHSPEKPVLVFVASRRQTRLTALDLISLCASSDSSKQFLHMSEEEAANMASIARDPALKHTLLFGIGIHHAGLDESDRNIVEELFGSGKIQILVCTSTLAWGVNFPAHLVVVKGTEYFDGRIGRYTDFPVTDVLQMIGRAGRPQFDTRAVAVILVHEPKKNFFKKFLYEPFPVESQLAGVLPNHLNAEIAGGSIRSREDAVTYMTWTFLFRRIIQNPSFYQLQDTSSEGVTEFLLGLVDSAIEQLSASGCVELDEDGQQLKSTPLGRIASYYYLDHKTVGICCDTLDEAPQSKLESYAFLCSLLSNAVEFSELPVRHNEDVLNAELAQSLAWPVEGSKMNEPNTKAFLLLQAHMWKKPLPISDYTNDTKSVLDQISRVIGAFIDISALLGLLTTTMNFMRLSQSISVASPPDSDPLIQLPGIPNAQCATKIRAKLGGEKYLPGGGLRPLFLATPQVLRRAIEFVTDDGSTDPINALFSLPFVSMNAEIQGVEMDKNTYILNENEEFTINVKIQVKEGTGLDKTSIARKVSKGRGICWWIVLGAKNDELLAMKKIGNIRAVFGTSLVFQPPEITGDSSLTVRLVADTIMGLDVEIDLPVKVVTENDSKKRVEKINVGSGDFWG